MAVSAVSSTPIPPPPPRAASPSGTTTDERDVAAKAAQQAIEREQGAQDRADQARERGGVDTTA